MCIWIKGSSILDRPVVDLTRKGQPFVLQERHEVAMQALMYAIVHSLIPISIEYPSDCSTSVT